MALFLFSILSSIVRTMIKLFSLKQQKKDEEGTARAGGSQKRASAAQLRITKGTQYYYYKLGYI